jgi:hypothetical protein
MRSLELLGKRKIQVTRSQVIEYVSRQGERQVYAQPLPQAKGQTDAEDVHARYMLDVVFARDLIVVFLVEVFTRKTWAKTVPNKSAASVGAAAKVLIQRLEEQPKVVSTDDGLEYAELAAYLKDKGIGHKLHLTDSARARPPPPFSPYSGEVVACRPASLLAWTRNRSPDYASPRFVASSPRATISAAWELPTPHTAL